MKARAEHFGELQLPITQVRELWSSAGLSVVAVEPKDESLESDFITSWRDELLARAWASLAADEVKAGQRFYAVLRFRADHPELRSPQMATRPARNIPAFSRPISSRVAPR